MKRLLENLRATLKYSDTQLYELSLSLLMVVLNPFHLLALVKCSHIESAMVGLLMVMSVLVGIALSLGVLSQKLSQRYFVSKLYWFFTLLTIVNIVKCGLHESGLLTSFILQFISSIYLIWRLGTEVLYRELRHKGKDNV